MAAIRAPSPELLRALRSSITAYRASTPSSPWICSATPVAQRTHLSASPRGSRSFSYTSTNYRDTAANKPSNSGGGGGTTKTVAQSVNPTNRFAPKSHDRGPTSKEDTQTDFGAMDIYGGTPEAATSVDACTTDGFHLNNGTKVTNAAVLLAGGEAWAWKPWLAISPSAKIGDMLDARRGTLKLPQESLAILACLHPKPDLLIVGTGSKNWMLDIQTRKYIMETLGIRVDVMDTANATSSYNLLAKERGAEGGSGVGGAFLQMGWKGPEGAGRRR